MLKNISPLLTPDLLNVLARMGHGDVIAIVDANFPAYYLADVPVAEFPTNTVTELCDAIVSVFPVDTFDDEPLEVMINAAGEPGESLGEVLEVLRRHGERDDVALVERHAFYDKTRKVRAVVHTGDKRGYSCYLLRKGVIGL